MSANTDYLDTRNATVPVTNYAGEKVNTVDSSPATTSTTATSTTTTTPGEQNAAMAGMGAHTVHIDHDAPHTAMEKPTLPRHGGM
ncbi:hypothetical protein PhCBS80983_g06078 [Powellomyces hirtus]|uniref:Uncharacterized protein n=1 Tax=Powellomyces hirtus TaxID=109895 RepID=A0A507DQM6_9FUNG|nr:hypothetical protein PhCBS80983_g06078 [Powellomyces hirtus]